MLDSLKAIPFAIALLMALMPVCFADELQDNIAKTLTLPYRQELQQVVDKAKASLKKQSKRHAIVVLDVDDTLLDMRSYYVANGAYKPDVWDAWVEKTAMPAIPETLTFIQWLERKHWPIVFMSGRRETLRKMTEDNLNTLGVTHYKLILRGAGDNRSASEYKQQHRRNLEKEGKRIALCMGDQASDCTGEGDKAFKLPNPVYTIP